MMSSKKRLVICMFTLLILATLMPLSAAAEQPILKGPAQEVINYKVYTQEATSRYGPWETISTKVSYKTLIAPSGYHYESNGTNSPSYSSPKEISSGYWVRTKRVSYKYKLVADD